MDSKKFFENKASKIAIAVLCCVLWGSAFPVLKISYKELSITSIDKPELLALGGLRFFIAAILLVVFTKFVIKQSLNIGKKNIMKLVALGFFQTAFYYYLFYNGVANTTGTKGAIIGTLETFFTVILAHFVYTNDRIDLNKSIGIVTGFIGIVIANFGKDFGASVSFLGEGLLALSCLMGAISSIMVKEFAKSIHPFVITSYQMLFGALMMMGVGYGQGASLSFNLISGSLLIYSALLSSVAFSLWFTLLKYNNAGEISLYRFLIPISGAILSAIFVGESFTIYTFLALILVVSGIIAVNLRKK